MKRKLLSYAIVSFLFLYCIIFSCFINAQQTNPPNLLKLFVYDCAGQPLNLVAISLDFKPIGVTDNQGYFIFENKGGILAISKPGFIAKLIQLPEYWKGEIKINLEYLKYEFKEDKNINYSRTIYLNNSPLINKSVLLINNYGNFKTYYTDKDGKISFNYKPNDKFFIFYIENEQNNLFFYFSQVKEDENGSNLFLNYAVSNGYYFDFDKELHPDFFILMSENLFLKLPIVLKTKPSSPYWINIGSNDYQFFTKFKQYIHFSFPADLIIKNYSDSNLQIPYLTYNFNVKEFKTINTKSLSSIFFDSIANVDDDKIFEKIYNIIDYHFINQDYFELNLKQNEFFQLSKISLYDYSGYLIIEGFLLNKITIPSIYFTKGYSLLIEMYSKINYDNLINNTNILSNDNYFGIVYKLR